MISPASSTKIFTLLSVAFKEKSALYISDDNDVSSDRISFPTLTALNLFTSEFRLLEKDLQQVS